MPTTTWRTRWTSRRRPPVARCWSRGRVLAWLDGRLPRAGALVADALVTGPPLHLARLVAELLARDVEPPWADK